MRTGRRGRGQATLELALVLPFVLVLALVITQVALLARAQVVVTHAAREGARAVAVDGRDDAAEIAVYGSTRLSPDRTEVVVRGNAGAGSRVTVEVRHRATTDVPIVGALLGDVLVLAEATMRVE